MKLQPTNNPLHGCRILDLTANISGPFSTMILADMGAEVIKIERLDKGDDSRQMTPFCGEWSVYFAGINRNKKSLALDIKHEQGMNVVYKLAASCDVVVENFRGGTAERLGLGYQKLKSIREDIIYCSLSAYGQAGEQRNNPGYDAIVQAQTGILSINGTNATDMARVGVSLLDMGSGMWAAMGILSALLHRQATGEGQFVATSLYESGIMWALYHLLFYQATGQNPQPQGTRHTAFSPYGAYETLDGQLFIGISNDRLFEKLCQTMRKTEWSTDARFRQNSGRLQHRAELDRGISEILKQQKTADWLDIFATAGIPCSEVKSISDVLEDPQLHAVNQLASVRLPGYGEVKIPRLPLQMDNCNFSQLRPAPLLGQDTKDILRKLGYTDEWIEHLIQSKVAAAAEASQ